MCGGFPRTGAGRGLLCITRRKICGTGILRAILELSSDRVIDACVYKINENIYKMWYKDEKHDSHTWSAVSSDLYHWDVCGEEISFNSHEGPNVFEFGGSRWMITDEWNGLGVYKTEDFTNWERNGVILRDGGSRPCDGVMANHADVVVSGENAYIFYFTHPYHSNENRLEAYRQRRGCLSCLYSGGKAGCRRKNSHL